MGEADAVVGISRDELRAGLPTPGMRREEAIATETTWAGLAHTEAGMVSGWHHHGDYESVIYVLTGLLRMESGPGGTSLVDAAPGDEGTAVVVRTGRGDPVVNVDGPAPSV